MANLSNISNKFIVTNVGTGQAIVGATNAVTGSTLTVGGAASFSGSITSGIGNNFDPIIREGRVVATPAYSFTGDLDTGMFNPNLSNTIAFGTAGVERLRIASNGYVGIGTNTSTSTIFNPLGVGAALSATDISSNYNPQILGIQNTNTTANNYSLIGFQDASANINVASMGALNKAHSSSPNSVIGSLVFRTKPSGSAYTKERMRIDSLGNVGIGTDSPAKKLDVARIATTFSGASTDEGAVIRLTNPSQWEVGYDGNGFLGGIEFYSGDDSENGPAVFGAIKQRMLTPYNDTAMCFFTSQSNGSLTERMRVTAGGNINLGTGSLGQVAYQLRVDSDFDNGFYMSAGSSSSNYAMYIENGAGSELFNVRGDGNVGIGTTAPSQPLEILAAGGYNKSSSGGQTTNGILIAGGVTAGDQNTTGGIGFALGLGTAGISGYQNGSDQDRVGLAFYTHGGGTGSQASQETMRIQSGGEIIIGGYLTPASSGVTYGSLLQLQKGFNTANEPDVVLKINNLSSATTAGTGGSRLIFEADETGNGNGDGAKRHSIESTYFGGVENWKIGSGGGSLGILVFDISGSEKMRIQEDGKVGIGTTLPQVKLHLDGTNFNTSTITEFKITDHGNNYNVNDVQSVIRMNGRYWSGDDNTAVTTEIRSLKGNGNGSTGSIMSFAVQASGGSTDISGNEAMRITPGGQLLIGKDELDISIADGFRFDPNGEGYASIPSTGANAWHVYDMTNNAYRFYVSGAGQIYATSNSISSLSDITLKENIKPLETGLDDVMKLKPKRFDWKNGDGKNIAGFIAQEVEQVLPDLVSESKYTDEETKKSLKMGGMIPTLVKAIQELKAEIELLKNK